MADTNVFTRLKRLFSTDVIIRNIGGDQLKVMDVNSIQKAGEIETNSLVDRFSRLHVTGAAPIYNPALNYQTMRVQLYSDYEAMDTDAIIASALDIIADECTLKDDMGEVLSIKSSDEDIQKVLYNLFYDVLNIEFNLWMWIRQMCKYGDFFLKLDIAEKYGVYNVIPYTAYNIVRQEGLNKDNPNEVTFQFDPDGLTGGGGGYGGYYGAGGSGANPSGKTITFDNYEMAHFRLLTDVNYLPYGRSYIEPGRKLFKQYTLMEDAMLVHRIVRAPEKRVYYINVGSIPPNEVDAFMEKTVSKMKRTPYVDEQTGDYNLKYNMQNMMEDFFIPVRGNDSATKIDTTKGLDYDGIQDVEYLRDKLFAALKVPKAFLGYDADIDGKATLAAEDIRFARTIDRIQRTVISELYKIATIHLYTQGYTDEQLSNFELSLTTPSIIYDQERIALMKEKVDLAASIMENKLLPTDWVYDNVFRFSENEYEEYRELTREDAKRKFRLNQIEAEGNDPLETGKSYGTPHDLASLYGQGRYQSDPGNVPDGYDEKKDLGRPKEKASNINTQDNAFGKDRLGKRGSKEDYNSSDSIKPNYKGGSPLALESMLKQIPINKKRLVFEQDKKQESLLDEDNIKKQKS
jgi:hypothetical protein|tara:strand:- start:1025 stop:2917 length:1893 start_codon:yes stop_codon:yes gene_type:complete